MTNPIAAVAAYDPYMGRALDGIRSALADGHPVLVRLHPAGVFVSAGDPVGDQLDREGHAVLLTGYDQERQAFRYFEPLANQQRWISYDEFGLMVVDSTFDFTLIMADLQFSCEIHDEHLEVAVHLYRPHMPVIDDAATVLEDVVVHLASGGRVPASAEADGRTYRARIPLALADQAVSVSGLLKGLRPTPYQRRVTRDLKVPAHTG